MTIYRENKAFTLTPEEIEAAYRQQLHNYLILDAEQHFSERYEDEELFARTYRFTVEQACDPGSPHYLLEDLVKRFEHEQACNISADQTWDSCIEAEMQRVSWNVIEKAASKDRKKA